MRSLVVLIVLLATFVAGCSDDAGDAPADLSGICPPPGVETDLNPFDALATGSAAEVESTLTSVSELYDTMLEGVPDDAEYPEAVLAATSTTPSTTTADGTAEGTAGDEEVDPPTPDDDLRLVADVLSDVREVLARHGYDVGAAEEDLQAVPALAEPGQLAEVVLATGRLRQLIQRECAPAATTTTTAAGGGG